MQGAAGGLPGWARGLDRAASLGRARGGGTGASAQEAEEAEEAEVERLAAERVAAGRKAGGRGGAGVGGGGAGALFRAAPRPGSLAALVEREARTRYLQDRCQEVLSEKELKRVREAILGWASGPGGGGGGVGTEGSAALVEVAIDYCSFCAAANDAVGALGPRVAWHFAPSLFARLPQDPLGRVSAATLYEVICGRNRRLQNRILLGSYDSVGDGTLGGADLEAFVDEIQKRGLLQAVRSVPKAFRLRWLEIAAQKFLFFHAGPRGRVRVQDVACGPILEELNALQPDPYATGSIHAALQRTAKNWFSVHSAQRVHHAFVGLNTGMNRELSKEEFACFGDGGLTRLFVDRVFEVHAGRGGAGFRGGNGMNFRAYTDFVIAWESKKHRAALKYFFQVLDLRGVGYLTHVEVHSFFREVHQSWIAAGNYGELRIEDVSNEIFDMVKPLEPGCITLADLVRSGCGGIVVDILADVNAFWRYDNRESLMHEDEDGEGEEGANDAVLSSAYT